MSSTSLGGLALAALLALPAGGCASCEGAALPPPDGGPVDGGLRDGGSGDGGAPAPRHLISRPLFGDLPLENRVFDPTFSLPTLAWIVYDENALEASLVRGLEADAPTRSPSLIVGRDARGTDHWTLGLGRGGPSPLFVRVFVAIEPGAPPPTLGVLGLGLDSGAPLAFDIPHLPDEAPFVDARGKTWLRFEGTLTADLPGWLVLEFDGIAPYEIAGPTLTQGTAPGGVALKLPPVVAAPRPATAHERTLLRRFTERLAHASTPPALLRRAQGKARAALRRRNARIIEQAHAARGSETP